MQKNEKINLSQDDSFLYTEEEIEPIFHNIMTQKINKKLDIILSKEISKRKKIIYDLFQKKFGPNFIEKKPESINHLESLMGKYFFSSKSKFLKKFFPKLYNKFFHTKKVDLEKLKSKINIGSMMYLNLRNHIVSNKSLINDKLFYISKNFTTKDEKDLVSNLYLKLKKNADKSSNNIHLSKKSLENISKICSNKSLSKFKNIKNNVILKDIKEGKKVIFNINSKENTNFRTLNLDNSKYSKTQKNFYRNRNKKTMKYNNEKTPEKISLKLLNKSPERYYDKYKNFYLSNPFYMYNSNIYNRNKNKYKQSKSGNFTITQDNRISHQISSKSGNFTITQDNYFSPQISFKSKNTNILKNSNYNISNKPKNSYFSTNTNSLSLENKTLSSFKNLDLNIKMKNINNIKNDSNNISNKINYNEDLKNTIKIDEKENAKNENNNNTIPINNDFKRGNSNEFQTKNKIYYFLRGKNSFEKYIKSKNKKYKKRINSEVKILNNYTNKCNKKLIKLIDTNFILSSKEKQKNKNKNVNFDITKLLLDDKIPKKVFIKYAKNKNTIKPIFKETVNHLTSFDNKNKDLTKKYFIKNINNIPTELALYFIGELYETNHIKFGLKEFTQKRDEQKLINDKKNLKMLRIKSKNHLYKIKQLEYILSNEKEAFFKKENEKVNNLIIFKKMYGKDKEIIK